MCIVDVQKDGERGDYWHDLKVGPSKRCTMASVKELIQILQLAKVNLFKNAFFVLVLLPFFEAHSLTNAFSHILSTRFAYKCTSKNICLD